MGWARGLNSAGVVVGYSVEAVCSQDGCEELIDKGLAYCCGGLAGVEGEMGCGKYFCGSHLFFPSRDALCDPCNESAEGNDE